MKYLLGLTIVWLFACQAPTDSSSHAAKSSDEGYIIEDFLIQTADGGSISGMVARNKHDRTPIQIVLFLKYIKEKLPPADKRRSNARRILSRNTEKSR